ncbi:MAG: hypothetical protein R3C49_09615 [Planctomycetaceae bacterium]
MEVDFRNCLAEYSGHGVRFSYPDIWEITEESDDGDILITVASPGTCFWTLRLLPGCPAPPQVVESCVAAFQEEYDEMEVEKVTIHLAEMPAYARQLEFFCMELMNTVGLASVRCNEMTILIWWQGTDHELIECQEILGHMTGSVRVDSLRDEK